LADGVSALVLRVGESGVAPSEVDRLLEGVYLELAPVMVDAGADYVAAADAVLALVAGLDAGTRAQLSIDLGADRLTAPLNGRPARAWTTWSRPRRGRPVTTAVYARSPLTVRPSTIWVRARRGSWPAVSPPGLRTCGSSATAALVFGMRCGRAASALPPTTISS
jgi:hypothetical protein